LDLALSDTNGALGPQREAAHPLFAGVGTLKGVVCYDTITYAAPAWRVLARDALGGPAILEGAVGDGRLLLIEPAIDRIACGAEAPPEGVERDSCQRFIENLARYAVQP
jgi:hypothetical protein